MKTFIICFLTCCLVVAPVLQGRDKIVIGGLDGLDPSAKQQPYSILLALSGGGARGLATIGILKAFEEHGIKVVAVAGTSMGGIIGGLYASGYTPTQMESILNDLDFTRMFGNTPARRTMFQTKRRERGRDLLSVRFKGFVPVIPRGLTTGQKLTEVLTRLTTRSTYHSSGDFSKLPIPFKAVSTDMISGKPVIIGSGSLTDAMRATTAYPLAFTGVERDGKLLMDGGMVIPIPVDIVKGMCDSVRFVVAVNTASPLAPKDKLVTPVDIANQATSIMTADKLATELAGADYIIEPITKDIQASDFKLKDSIIQWGYRIGQVAADSIRSRLKQQQDSVRIRVDSLEIAHSLNAFENELTDALSGRFFTRSELIATLKKLTIDLGLFRLETEITVEKSDSSIRPCRLSLSGYPYLDPLTTSFIFKGNRIFDVTVLRAQINFDSSLITPTTLRKALHKILKLYRQRKYDLADIREVHIDPTVKRVTVTVDEAIVNRIDVIGAKRTRNWFIKSLFPLKENLPYSTRMASQGIMNIFGTDLFNRVSVDLLPANGETDVKIRVEEKRYRQMRLGWHWDDEYDSEEFAELLDDNIAGAGLELLFHTRYSPDRRNYYANFKADRIFSTYLTGNVRLYASLLDRHLYNTDDSLIDKRRETKTGFEVRLGQQISRLGTVTAGIEFENVAFEKGPAKTEEKFGLRIFKLESLVENFDRIPFPNSGKKHFFELQFAGKLFGGDVEYTRFYTSIEGYFPLGKHFNYHPRIAIGISRSGLPVTEKFYLGGMKSLYGFHTHQLSGDKMFLMSHELRVKLPLWLYFSLRYDLGNVFGSADDIKLKDLQHAGGISLALDSPLGPFEIGYGIAEDNFDRLYLRFGYSF